MTEFDLYDHDLFNYRKLYLVDLKKEILLFLTNGTSGSFAAIIATIFTYPFENIKTRMQLM